MTNDGQLLAETVDAMLRDAVAVLRAELFVRYMHDWARIGGRVVPWEILRERAQEHAIDPAHLAVALQNLHAETRHVGDWDCVHIPAEIPHETPRP